MNHHNFDLSHLALDEKNHFINVLSARNIWETLVDKNHPDAPGKFKKVLETYKDLCEKYNIDPRI
jgi:hypothetical protein